MNDYSGALFGIVLAGALVGLVILYKAAAGVVVQIQEENMTTGNASYDAIVKMVAAILVILTIVGLFVYVAVSPQFGYTPAPGLEAVALSLFVGLAGAVGISGATGLIMHVQDQNTANVMRMQGK